MSIVHTQGNPDANRILNQSWPNRICKSHPKIKPSSWRSLVPLPRVCSVRKGPLMLMPPRPPLFTGCNNRACGEWRRQQSSKLKEKFFKIFQSSSFIKRKILSPIHTFAFFMMYLKGTVWPHCVTSKSFSQQFMLSDCFTILKQLMIKLLVSNPHYKAIMSKPVSLDCLI